MGRGVSAILGLVSLFLVETTLGNDDADRSLTNGSRGHIFPRDVSRAHMAVRLSRVVFDTYKDDSDIIASNYGFDPSNGIYLASGVDAVYLARVGNEYCVAAFRGTVVYQPEDFLTNVDLDPIPFEMTMQQENETKNLNNTIDDTTLKVEDCEVHQGYHDAYTEFEYREQVEEFLSDCRSECLECDTMLTGYSQGGAIASIAALYYKERTYNRSVDSPYIVTFGAPQSLGAPCAQYFSESEKQKWYRYILSRESGGKLVYDPFPLLYPQLLDPPEGYIVEEDGFFWDNYDGFRETQTNVTYARKSGLAYIGHEILLSSEDPSSVFLSEYDGHRFVDLSFMDMLLLAHFASEYAAVLEAQYEIYKNDINEDCRDRDVGISNVTREEFWDEEFWDCLVEPLPSSGFAVGSVCNPDEIESTCADGMVCEAEKKDWFWQQNRYSCQQLQTEESSSLAVGSTCNPDESPTCARGTTCEAEEKKWFWHSTRYSCQPLLSKTRRSSIVAPIEENYGEEKQEKSFLSATIMLETGVSSGGYRIRMLWSVIGIFVVAFGVVC